MLEEEDDYSSSSEISVFNTFNAFCLLFYKFDFNKIEFELPPSNWSSHCPPAFNYYYFPIPKVNGLGSS